MALQKQMGGADLRVIPAVTKLTVYRRPQIASARRVIRVPLAVTWLTVHRQLQIMRTGQDSQGWGPKLSAAGRAVKHDVLRIVLSDFDEGHE